MQREWIHINVVLRVNEKQESNFKKHHKLQVLMHYNDNQVPKTVLGNSQADTTKHHTVFNSK